MIHIKKKELIKLQESANNFEKKRDYLRAKIQLKKLIKLDPKNLRGINNLANLYKETNDIDNCIKLLKKAITIDDNYLIAKINLAILYHEIGKLSEASILYKEIIKLDPENFGVYFNLSRIDFSYFDINIINFIENKLNEKQLSDFNKASGNFVIAKYYQKEKNFKKEIFFLQKAHEHCYKSEFKRNEASLFYWLSYIPNKFNKIHFNYQPINSSVHENSNNINLDINPIFIFGLPRSGTTLVEGLLSSGFLKIPNGGETATINWAFVNQNKDQIFKKDSITENIKLDVKINDLKKHIINRYDSLNLLKKNQDYIFTDKSLENFFYIELILKLFPNSKFINCRRNLNDLIFAIYQQFFTKMSWTHSIENILKYIDNYLKIIKHFKDKYPNKILDVDLEALTENSSDVSKKIYNFSDLKWSNSCLNFYKRKDLLSKTASNLQIREKIYKYDRLKYLPYKEFLKKYENRYKWLKNISFK
jgi:hypothetical protein